MAIDFLDCFFTFTAENITNHPMKGLIKTLLVLAVIAVVMMLTCPNEEKHVEKLTKEMTKELKESTDSESLAGMVEGALVGWVGDDLLRPLIKSTLVVDDYALLTVGKMKGNGKERVVTIGMFGHVFYLRSK